MALVEPGPTGVKTAAEAEASVAQPAADLAERKLGAVFWLAMAWIVLLVFLALFRDLLPLRDPEALGIRTREVRKFEDPSWNAWFGGDSQGRDQLARIVQGTRPALIIGVAVTTIAGLLGTAIGVTSGYLRGRFDAFTTVVIDIFLAFPGLVLLIAVRASFGNSMPVFIVLFSITSIPAYARIVRGASFALSEREFVDAAAAMGATKRRVLWKELAPNVAIPALSFAFIGFALVIVGEGALAFIGLSLDEVTWGKLIAEGTGDIRDHAHISLIPATVMFLTILAFNLAGDGIRRLYSPREVATQRRLRIEGSAAANPDGSVLHIADLYTTLHTPSGDVHAVDGVSLSVRAGQALGVGARVVVQQHALDTEPCAVAEPVGDPRERVVLLQRRELQKDRCERGTAQRHVRRVSAGELDARVQPGLAAQCRRQAETVQRAALARVHAVIEQHRHPSTRRGDEAAYRTDASLEIQQRRTERPDLVTGEEHVMEDGVLVVALVVRGVERRTSRQVRARLEQVAGQGGIGGERQRRRTVDLDVGHELTSTGRGPSCSSWTGCRPDGPGRDRIETGCDTLAGSDSEEAWSSSVRLPGGGSRRDAQCAIGLTSM